MGGKGSGGFNKKSIEQHIRDGTYRIDRHGPVPKRLSVKAAAEDKQRVKASKTNKKDKASSLSAKQNSLSAKDALGGGRNKAQKDIAEEKIETPIICPDWFDDYAKAEFVRVCQVLHDQGALQDVNHATLEGYCAAYSRAVRAEMELKDGFEVAVTFYTKTGDPYDVMKKRTEVGVAEKAWMQVKTFAVELGITSSRGPQAPPEEAMTELERTLQAAERKPR